MGFQTEFNWVVKLTSTPGFDVNTIETGNNYTFSKEENRTYPINIPIDLADHNWKIIAKIVVSEYLNRKNITEVKFKILRTYNNDEKEFLNNYWSECIDYMKNNK